MSLVVLIWLESNVIPVINETPLQLTLKFLVLVMAALNQMKQFLTLRFLVLVILSLLEPHQFRHQEGRIEFGIRVI